MIRRRTLVALSGAALLGLGLLAAGGLIAITQTHYGRARIRDLVIAELRGAIHGRVYIGSLSGNLLTHLTIDSLEIRDPDGFLFLAAGRITATYDPRDLVARKIALRDLELDRPVLNVIHHRDDRWNLRQLFPPHPSLLPLDRLPSRVRQLPREAARGFGDYIVLDTVTVRDGSIAYIMPWDPSDTLQRAPRDSAIADAMRSPRENVSRWPEGLVRTLQWSHIDLAAPHVRIVDPDSAGVAVVLTRLDADESDPPFRFQSVRGLARIISDTAFLEIPHVSLPGSAGRGSGKLWWKGGQPLSASLHFLVDSVSLADIAWIYPTLPRTGGGHGLFDMQSDVHDPHIASYTLSGLDVRTTQSHVRGTMTFVIGHPTLVIRDIALQMDPLDFALIQTLTGKPFPVDWAGQFTGFVRGAGGPLPRFRVDTTDLTFRDAHIAGAVSHLAGAGELNVTDLGETVFHHFRLSLPRLDMRTPEFVIPKVGHLQGVVSGTATLDSLWHDVSLHDLNLAYRDGDGDATELTGGGHITLGDSATTYDLDLRADPVAFTTLARSYPSLWLRGSLAGPLSMRGRLDDLNLVASLTGPAGTLHLQGHVNAVGPTYAARGTLALADMDPSALIGGIAGVWAGRLTGRALVDLAGDSLGDLAGSLDVNVDRSVLKGYRISSGEATLEVGAGHLRIDSLHTDWALGSLRAVGGLGLVPGVRDSLLVTAAADSLGGLRRYLAPDSARRDSLTGTLRLAATLSGRLDSLRAVGTLGGGDVRVDATRVHRIDGAFAVANITTDPTGSSRLDLDGIVLAGVALEHVNATARFAGAGRTFLGIDVAAPPPGGAASGGPGPHAATAVTILRQPDATTIAVDTFALSTGTNVWHLSQRPARMRIDDTGIAVDPFTLRGAAAGWIAAHGTIPVAGASDVRVVADSIPLADLGAIIASPTPLSGLLSADWTATGPRATPTMILHGVLDHPGIGAVRIDGIRLEGAYVERRLDLHADVVQRHDTTLRAEVLLPVDLALVPVPARVLDNGALRGSIQADSAQFAALATVLPTLEDPRGVFLADVAVGGTLRHPTLWGTVRIANAEAGFPQLGVRLVGIAADLRLVGDSMAIRNLSAATVTADRRGEAALKGWITYGDLTDPRFQLTLQASDFHVVHHPRLADIEVSTTEPLELTGRETQSRLRGAVRVDRGTLYLRDVLQKQVINLDDPELYTIVDTSLAENQRLLPSAPPRFIQGLRLDTVRVTLAQDVWLKSAEATINLSTAEGALFVTTAPVGNDSTRAFALEGTLVAARGDYRLNLGIVQRTFIVDHPGTVRFMGGADFNPTLNITAVQTVRQPQTIAGDVKPDVRIRVTLSGTLQRPVVALSSADTVQQYSQSDLLSYLVTGHPSYDVTSGGNAAMLTSVVLPTLGTALGSQLSGGLFDYVQVQPGGYSQIGPQAGTAQGALFNTLSGTRIGAGKQIGARTFVSADVGVCQLGSLSGGTAAGTGAAAPGFADQIGVRVERELTSHFSITAGSEPGTNALYCTSAYSRSFVTTPRQWGLDLFHLWQF